MGYIYCFKNLINKKIYIGKTFRNPNIAYRHYIKEQTRENSLLFNEIKKYGKENFLFYVIGKFPDEKLNEWQRFYIKKFNSYKDGYGYNISYETSEDDAK